MKRSTQTSLPPQDDTDAPLPLPPLLSDTDASKIVSAHKNVSTHELLSKYDLHHLDLHELEVFLTLLHQRREISEETATRLLVHGYCIFDTMPDDAKVDFIEALERRALVLVGTSAPAPHDGMMVMLFESINGAIDDAKRLAMASNAIGQ